MSNKDHCKELMSKFFGPNSASMVDMMGEDDCVTRCKQKVMMLLGPDKAAEFDMF